METAYRTTLELDKVIARAVQLCACRETKEMMQEIEPYLSPEEERWRSPRPMPSIHCISKTEVRASSRYRTSAALRPTQSKAASCPWENCWKWPWPCAILLA